MKKILTIFGIFSLIFFLTSCDLMGGGTTDPKDDDKEGITFVTNGGNEIDPITDLESGDKVKLPTPVKEGYEFAGWYTDEELSYSAKVKNPSAYVYDEPITLYADWLANSYILTIVSEEVEFNKTSYSILAGNPIYIDMPTSPYFEFEGWYEGNTKFEEMVMPTHDLILTAKWVGKDITLKFDFQGATAPDGFKLTYEIKAGDTFENLPTPEKANAIFVGWYDGTTKTASKYTESTPILVNTTLYARFDDLSNYESSYPINYVLNGGAFTTAVEEEYQVGVTTTLPIPEKENAEFVGWYTSPVFYGNETTQISNVQLGAVTFYAKWKAVKDTYAVTFVKLDGSTEVKNVSANQKVAEISAGSLGGEALTWYNGWDKYNFDDPVTEDLTLTLNWDFLSTTIATIIPEVFYDNEALQTSLTIGGKAVTVSWASSDETTISKTGVTNPLYDDAVITLTATFKYNSQSATHKFNVIVPKVEFKDLSTFKPVFAYLTGSGYVGFDDTALATIDVVNVAFGRMNDDATISVQELISKLPSIVQLRKQGIRVVLSLGGANAASLEKFSNAASTSENRRIFAESCLEVVRKYHLDGIDMDWEYPGYNTGRDVSVDRPNFTLMMAKLSQVLEDENPELLLTAAVPGGRWGIDRYQVDQLNNYFDYFHLMTYDFHDSQYAYHHCALYSSPYTSFGSNADWSVQAWHDAGADMDKLVIGAAFYGRVYILNGPANKMDVTTGLGSSNVSSSGGYATYTTIYNDYLMHRSDNIIYYHDGTAQAGSVYIKNENKIVVFDDPASIKAKCEYVVEKDIGGIMFWEFSEDKTGTLLAQINKSLK